MRRKIKNDILNFLNQDAKKEGFACYWSQTDR